MYTQRLVALNTVCHFVATRMYVCTYTIHKK